MRWLLSSFVALCVSSSIAHADEVDPCVAQSNLAGIIMEAHQASVPLTQIMEVLAENEVGQLMARDAYNRPRFSTPGVQRQAVEDFRDRMALLCYEAHAGG